MKRTAPRPLTLERLSLYLELSLGLSARKEIATSSWYLRMNPSSGNLHPTEAYVVPAKGEKRFTVAAMDLGLKRATPWHMSRVGCEVHVLPATATASDPFS